MEEYPDELRITAPAAGSGSGGLGDFLWETASWDPVVERLAEAGRDGPGRELVTAARRLLAERLLTEPSQIARLVRLMAAAGVLGAGDLDEARGGAARAGNLAGGRRQGPDPDPMGAGIPRVGRETERALAVRGLNRSPDGVSMVCITGPAGVGKTRLAREVAAGHDQPAGRLLVSLSRPAPGTENRRLATTPYEALASLLAQLAVPDGEIPATLDGRRARYVSELAGQAPVILLDDALYESQVPLLLPPRRGSVVLTSRSSMTGLTKQTGLKVHYVALGPVNADWSRRLVQQVFHAVGVAADDRAATAIHRWSDGRPWPAILLARWAAVTAKAEGLVPSAVTERLAAVHRDGDGAAAVLGLLDRDQQAVLRALALPGLPQADPWTVALATGLSREQAEAALERLARLGLVGAGARDGTWAADPLAAGYVLAQALAAGGPAETGYERALGPVIGLYGLRAQALRDLMAPAAPEHGPVVQAWARRQWRAEHASLVAVLEAAAAASRPAMGRRLAAAFVDAAAAAGRGGGRRESQACLTAIALIARDAGDQRLEHRALEWLDTHDRLQGLSGPEPAGATVDPPGQPAEAAQSDGLLPVEQWLGAGRNAPPSAALLFGAGDRRP